jgi:alpha-tubulin suppressor-like RCC1 family protein
MNRSWLKTLFGCVAAALCVAGCSDTSTQPPETPTPTVPTPPTVTTNSVSGITSTTATAGGQVTADGGAPVTARGVVWSASPNPTVSDKHTTDGTGAGSFASAITDLLPEETYHVRAYATNSAGTAYGQGVSFTTDPAPPPAAVEALFGNHQEGQVGHDLPDLLGVRVTDADGNPVAGVVVAWAPAAGGGSVAAAESTTNSAGVATSRWTVGPDQGEHQLMVAVDSLTATFRATAFATAPIAVHAGSYHTCARTFTGETYCWGWNQLGNLGDGTSTHQLTPVRVQGGHSFTEVSAGGSHTCGRTADMKLSCWGGNPQGGLGDGTQTHRSSPVLVQGDHSFVQVSSGSLHTCGGSSQGETLCWGSNNQGRLGDGTTTDRLTPVRVTGSTTFAQVSAGGYHTCGLTPSGEAYCWGSNGDGQLGDGTTSSRGVPHPVHGEHRFVQLITHWRHTCGLTTAGAAYCWGWNVAGQLGDGTLTDRSTPVAVVGGHSFVQLSTGTVQSCGLTSAGQIYCWGRNFYGELGDGDGGPTKYSPTPVLVQGGHHFTMLSGGSLHTCGRTAEMHLYCWGSNEYGALGDGTTDNALTPVRVNLNH